MGRYEYGIAITEQAMKKIIPYTAFTVLVITAFATNALADAEDVKAASEAKISLVQAIQAAEKHQGGKAIDASIDDDSFTPTYEVSVVKDAKLYDVRIDAVSGGVLNTREDKDD